MKTMTRWLAVAGLGLAAVGPTKAELLAWWPFDSAESAPGRDASKRGRATLVFLNGAGELSEGRAPGSLAWNTGGVDFGYRNDFPATPAFSFAAWVRREPARAFGQLETVARLGERNAAGWALYVGSDGFWNAYAYGKDIRRLDTRAQVTPGAWMHVALTFAPASAAKEGGELAGLLSLYVDGRLAAKGEYGISGAGAPAAFMLGSRYAKAETSWPFEGQISQAAIWDEALPPTLIAELAKGASPGQIAGGR